MKHNEFIDNEDSNIKRYDFVIPETETECLEFLHALMTDVQRIYLQLTDSQYALERFGSNTTDERTWRFQARKAYDGKMKAIERNKQWLKDKGFKSVSSVADIENRLVSGKPLQAPNFIMNGNAPKEDTTPVQKVQKPYDWTKSDILMQQALDRLKTARESANMTQDVVGSLIGYAGKTISQWELGQNPIKLEWFIRLCDVYNVDAGYILTGKRGKVSPKRLEKHVNDLTELRDILSDIIDNHGLD